MKDNIMNNTQKKQKNKTTITFTNKELNVIYDALTELQNMTDSNKTQNIISFVINSLIFLLSFIIINLTSKYSLFKN